MKKFTILLSLSILFSVASAQWQFGPRVGLNFSTVSGQWGSGEGEHYWITGFEAGGVANYALDDMLSIGSELIYITSGAKYEWLLEEDVARSVQSTDAYWIERYGNLRLPIYAKATFGDEFKFYGLLGPYFNYILCGKYKDVIGSQDYEQKGKIKFGEEPDNYDGDDWYINSPGYYKIRRFDIGMYVGAGGQYKIGEGSLAFEFRFGLGFLDTYNFENNDYKSDEYKPYKNRNISLSFVYTMPCDK